MEGGAPPWRWNSGDSGDSGAACLGSCGRQFCGTSLFSIFGLPFSFALCLAMPFPLFYIFIYFYFIFGFFSFQLVGLHSHDTLLPACLPHTCLATPLFAFCLLTLLHTHFACNNLACTRSLLRRSVSGILSGLLTTLIVEDYTHIATPCLAGYLTCALHAHVTVSQLDGSVSLVLMVILSLDCLYLPAASRLAARFTYRACTPLYTTTCLPFLVPLLATGNIHATPDLLILFCHHIPGFVLYHLRIPPLPPRRLTLRIGGWVDGIGLGRFARTHIVAWRKHYCKRVRAFRLIALFFCCCAIAFVPLRLTFFIPPPFINAYPTVGGTHACPYYLPARHRTCRAACRAGLATRHYGSHTCRTLYTLVHHYAFFPPQPPATGTMPAYRPSSTRLTHAATPHWLPQTFFIACLMHTRFRRGLQHTTGFW